VAALDAQARRRGTTRAQVIRAMVDSGIGTVDYLVAATAEINECRLATLNIRQYPLFPGLAAPFDLTPRN